MREMKIIACNVPYNEGGLGKFLATLVEQARADGQLAGYYATAVKPNDPLGRELSLQKFRWLFRAPPLRGSHAWRDFLASDLFDRAVATKLTPASGFTGFSGRALRSFRRARVADFTHLVLESATSHVDNVWRQHRKATRAFPIEESWLNGMQYRKTLREYDLADVIYVSSEYARQTFLDAGMTESKIQRRFQPVAQRWAPPPSLTRRHGFHVVYVGRLQVSKGVPVLLDAFARLPDEDARLTLVGGTASDAMERYLRRRVAEDRRIQISPGDPLSHLHRADVLVHPSFEDGLGLAPLEALACGVPVIVTEDTGMKEFVVGGSNGYVLPAGDIEALVEQLQTIRAQPLKGTFEPYLTPARV